MANQVQCPHCGGFKIDSKNFRIDPTTGNSIASGCGKFVLYFMLAVSGYMMVGLFGAFIDQWGLALFGLGGLILFIFIITFLKKNRQAEKRAYTLFKYHCNLCGYNWDWRVGEMLPEVHVRPDLISKGEQRLEEERQQRDPRLR